MAYQKFMNAWVARVFAAVGVAAATGQALAAYPERPVRMVIPYTAGGPADVVGRDIAMRLGETLGQSVVVVNAGGGHGIPALNQVLGAPTDGYTLFMPASGNLVVPTKIMRDNNPVASLAPISLLTQSPHVLVASATLPVTSMQELVDYAKAHPGQVNFASSGVGGLSHLAIELFKSRGGVDVVHVPYKGTSHAISDLASGQVQALFSSMPSLKPLIDKGLVRALAMSAPSAGADTATLPVMSQTLPGMEYVTWYGLFAKVGTPPDVIATLNRAVAQVVKQPGLKEKFHSQGIELASSTPQELAQRISRDTQKWTDVIQQAGMTLE